MTTGLVGPAMQVSYSPLSEDVEVATTSEILKRSYPSVQSPSYPSIALGPQCFVLVHGMPGSGKSTMATKWLSGTRGVYLSAEEGLSTTLAERIKRCQLPSDESIVFVHRTPVDKLLSIVRKHKADWLVIDSLPMTTFRPEEVRMLASNRVRGVVAIQQSTKAGQASGSNAFLHEADVLIRCVDGAWQIEKSRYQVSGVHGQILGEDNARSGTGDVFFLPRTSRQIEN